MHFARCSLSRLAQRSAPPCFDRLPACWYGAQHVAPYTRWTQRHCHTCFYGERTGYPAAYDKVPRYDAIDGGLCLEGRSPKPGLESWGNPRRSTSNGSPRFKRRFLKLHAVRHPKCYACASFMVCEGAPLLRLPVM